MITRFSHITLFAGTALFFLSCNNTPSNNHGPIVLGDSSTIVTENDPQKLKDLVTDLQPVIPSSENKEEDTKPETKSDTAKTAKAETTPANTQQPSVPDVAGLKAEFKEVAILIPGLNVKQAGNPNLQKANGAVYSLQGGEINGSSLKISGNITKVSQRYQTVVVLKNDMGTLLLDALGTTTGWKQINGNGTYKITGLDAASLVVPDADGSDIRQAATKAAQHRRWSRKKIQELQNEIRRVRNPNQKPLSLVLRSVMWKIDGKDAQGKLFSKQVRVDVPL
jgi:hypothetical protein